MAIFTEALLAVSLIGAAAHAVVWIVRGGLRTRGSAPADASWLAPGLSAPTIWVVDAAAAPGGVWHAAGCGDLGGAWHAADCHDLGGGRHH
ncbi:MAG: hypothetical protein IPL61_24025 [Myxococcales bacterium]|nr:hypothetical protein [Myxococcales bacterium]